MRLLLTDKWIETVPLIRILCFAWIWWPASNMSWQLLNAKHRSDYCLKAEIIKKSDRYLYLGIFPLLGYQGGLHRNVALLCGRCLCDHCIFGTCTAGVTFASEMKSMLPILAYAAVMGTGVYLLDHMISSDAVSLAAGTAAGSCFTWR